MMMIMTIKKIMGLKGLNWKMERIIQKRRKSAVKYFLNKCKEIVKSIILSK